MKENKDINWYRIINIFVIILFIILLHFCSGKRYANMEVKPIDTTSRIAPPIPEVATITEKVDTAELISYCVKNGLYKNLFPVKKVKSKPDTVFVDSLVYIDKVDTAYIYRNIYHPKYETVYIPKDFIFECEKVVPYFGVGINTLPSISFETGVVFNHSWMVGFEAAYNIYNGTFNNAVLANEVSVTVMTKSVMPNESKIGVLEFPRFSAGLKVIKIF